MLCYLVFDSAPDVSNLVKPAADLTVQKADLAAKSRFDRQKAEESRNSQNLLFCDHDLTDLENFRKKFLRTVSAPRADLSITVVRGRVRPSQLQIESKAEKAEKQISKSRTSAFSAFSRPSGRGGRTRPARRIWTAQHTSGKPTKFYNDRLTISGSTLRSCFGIFRY